MEMPEIDAIHRTKPGDGVSKDRKMDNHEYRTADLVAAFATAE